MSLRSRARYLLPKNPVSSLSLTSAWLRKIRETRIEENRVPIHSLSREDREKRLRYWNRMEHQNAIIGLVIFGFLIADTIIDYNILAIIGTIGAGVFVGSHWYYARRMKQLLSEKEIIG